MSAALSARRLSQTIGRKFYDRGNLCKNGHLAPRRVIGGDCVICSAQRIKARNDAVKGTPEEKVRCQRKAARQRAENPEKLNARTRAWRAKNPDHDKHYRKNNLGLYAAHAMKRYAGLKTATPAWSESPCIVALYDIASSLRAAGADVQIDHVVPLKGEKVSGLHVRNNLRIIPRAMNQRKNNSFVVA